MDPAGPAPDPARLRRPALLLLVLSLGLSLGPALSASRIDPPANDYLLHGQLVAGAAETLRTLGWTEFQDPWFDEINGGYPVFHHYPHLAHQVTAAAAELGGFDAWSALAAAAFLAVLLLPLGVYGGGRILGLAPTVAAAAAFVFVTTRSLDAFGHAPLAYGSGGHGLFGQLWGMLLASLALPAWVAASLPGGAGLARLPRISRVLLAALLVSLVLRCSLPAGWVLGLVAAVVVAGAGPARTLPARMARFAGVGALAFALAAGFLVPFLADLDATNQTVLEMRPGQLRSLGALAVLERLVLGDYLDGGRLGPWTPLLLATLLGLGLAARRGALPPLGRGLGLACLVSLALLFGRATWGDWVTDLPLLGRFHDHRYLLGLQLLAPWVLALGLSAGLAALAARVGRTRAMAAGVAVGALALGLQVHATVADHAEHRANSRAFEAARPQLDDLVAQARAARSPVALAEADSLVGATTKLAWLRRSGLRTFGRPLYHYSPVHDFALYWTRWAAGPGGAQARPEDLLAAGVGSLLGAESPASPAAALVRSDVVFTTEGTDLQGLGIRWFREGMHRGRQYPRIDGPAAGAGPASRTLRRARLEDHDPAALQGLAATGEGKLGEIVALERGVRSATWTVQVEVVSGEGCWLVIPVGWHPRWQVEIDGQAAVPHLLLPGWVGVPLEPGTSRVELRWRAAPWRGPAAALGIVATLAILGIVLVQLRRSTAPSEA